MQLNCINYFERVVRNIVFVWIKFFEKSSTNLDYNTTYMSLPPSLSTSATPTEQALLFHSFAASAHAFIKSPVLPTKRHRLPSQKVACCPLVFVRFAWNDGFTRTGRTRVTHPPIQSTPSALYARGLCRSFPSPPKRSASLRFETLLNRFLLYCQLSTLPTVNCQASEDISDRLIRCYLKFLQ